MARRWCTRIKLIKVILMVVIFSVACINLRSYITIQRNIQATEEVIIAAATEVDTPVPNKKGFLTIAIPTVSRKGAVYIYSTLGSLINKLTLGDNPEITIVILLADTNQIYNEELAINITNEYKELVTRKVIHFVKIPPRYYPDFNNLKITFNDSLKRVQWRSKQNLDYAYVMTYAANLSQYYMQLEDDVIATERYLTKIKDFIDQHSDKRLEHSKFREELIRLMGSDVIRLNDREWNERFHRRIEEEYHRTLDQKEKALAEAEEKRIRKLKLEGLVPMSDDSDNDRFHHKPSANNRKKRLTKSHKKQKKNSQQISGHSYDNHQNIYRPTEDVCTQIEVVYQKEPVPSESSEECIPNKSRSPSAVSERNNNEEYKHGMSKKFKDSKEMTELYEAESVIGLYSMAEKLVLR